MRTTFLLTFYISVAPLWLTVASSAAPVDFVRDVRPIFEKHCIECHGEKKRKSGLRLDVKAAALKGGDNHGPDIIPGKAKESPLVHFLTTDDEDELMPPKGRLSAAEIAGITRWIDQGAVWPDGVDRAEEEDLRDHWAFKSVAAASAGKIDDFIGEKLRENGLAMSPPAAPAAWLRRVTFDLTGLPPTPEEAAAFARACTPNSPNKAYEEVVERLLASPRYGERWSQHWLDVVRYADTHGFEVNTERPNAWPYRDYVIRAFNADVPYDRFIREQIAGDSLGADAATGFLVTASVLLPGQIGKDAPSIRLARQDSLDEMVTNIGQTFLGLSVGCARCHDHKFDPITAKDYYAMQAFVAGVEYEDRPIRGADAEAREKEVATLRGEVAALEGRLMTFAPLAQPGGGRRTTNPKENVENFPAVDAKFVRFTISDTNRHPNLGLIEPCIDEFEIFTDGPQPRNLALTSAGTKVTASGSRESSAHKLAHINDGAFGNSRSWMASEAGRGWVMFEFTEPARISRVVWGRDREGKFTDRLATAFTLEAGLSPESMKTLASVRPPRPTVNWRHTVDRFAPVKTERLRFTVLATNGLEPCLDEVEIVSTTGRNVARSAKVTASGSRHEAGRHELAFINDGHYGNERSWMSNEHGKGWVEFAFGTEEEITRVHWSRDRNGKFEDRMPIEYRIEAFTGGAWKVVADSTDRRPFVAGAAIDDAFTLSGLSADESRAASALLDEKTKLEARIKSLQVGQLAFAGKFREPDKIHLLLRGDPEQPKDEISPAVPVALGKVALTKETPEQQRRAALADWIASAENPLTARVMVNRIWQGHFGTGLVATPSDFGRNGMKPTHPALLDWMAREFVRSGWSVKHMHRMIVLSHTYRQSSAIQPAAAAKDADVRLLWRFPARRLEAETIRDSMLAVAGTLNPAMYGRGFDLFSQRGGLTGFTPIETLSPENQRRMIYAHKVRRESEAVFGAFDCPDAGQSTAVRRVSTTPVQALNLFNSRFTLALSDTFAARVRREFGYDIAMQINRAYQLALGRDARPEELAEADPIVRQHGLATVCRALFNSNEFLFVP